MTFKLTKENLKRTVYLFDQFNQESAKEVTDKLLKLEAESSDDIYLMINSYGGAVYSLLAILDVIRGMKAKVNTVCLGISASCGANLFVTGAKRYIGENSTFMIHQVSSMSWGTVDEMKDELKVIEDLDNKIFNILLNHCNLSEERLKELYKKDSYISAEEAVSYGFADEIIKEQNFTEYYTDSISEFVNAFKGANKDRAIAMAMASIDTVSKPILQNKKKGEKNMELNEVLNVLKEQHNIDYTAITNELEATKTELSEAKAQVVTLENEKEQIIKAEKESKIDALLEKLIAEGKSSKVLNEGYKVMFNNIDYEKAVEFCNTLPVTVKTTRKSVDGAPVNDKEADKLAIQALVESKNISFADAATEYYKNKK